jgi:hypothetical protein
MSGTLCESLPRVFKNKQSWWVTNEWTVYQTCRRPFSSSRVIRRASSSSKNFNHRSKPSTTNAPWTYSKLSGTTTVDNIERQQQTAAFQLHLTTIFDNSPTNNPLQISNHIQCISFARSVSQLGIWLRALRLAESFTPITSNRLSSLSKLQNPNNTSFLWRRTNLLCH